MQRRPHCTTRKCKLSYKTTKLFYLFDNYKDIIQLTDSSFHSNVLTTSLHVLFTFRLFENTDGSDDWNQRLICRHLAKSFEHCLTFNQSTQCHHVASCQKLLAMTSSLTGQLIFTLIRFHEGVFPFQMFSITICDI